ncbi:filamentous hemagglutinin N-terminal domain-containing protein, partial [Argonema galeatum]|uniref:filamentous hemagglutinin N-terminal domain-containing protein n=1 Tax=Argonema galeatum TaxID=2942762 RepID=UPI00201365C9
MKLHHLKFWLAQVSTLFFLLTCKLTSAQIVPDSTLPVNSIATPSGNTTTITGGTQAGTNLFHSFGEFSIPTDNTAFFNNALDIQNIISRVTGGSISNIDGLIKANGTANLFLLNPNGIIFGLNAKLNIGGSFLASTANSLNFADGTQFSAKPVQTTPLLTVSVPIGLQLSGNTGKITVQGSEIQVPPERTLTLVGSDITLTGGNLTAQRGRIELVSLVSGNWPLINSPAQITDNEGISTEYGDIQLSQQAIVDASGLGGGNIQVRGRRISLTDGSQIRANTQGAELAGNVTVRASDTVELIGVGNLAEQGENIVQPSAISTETTGAGNAGNLEIVTGRLIVRDGSQVSASTSGTGNGGILNINANNIELIGRSPDGSIPSG